MPARGNTSSNVSASAKTLGYLETQGIGVSGGIGSWPRAGIKLVGVKSDEMKAIRTSHGSELG